MTLNTKGLPVWPAFDGEPGTNQSISSTGDTHMTPREQMCECMTKASQSLGFAFDDIQQAAKLAVGIGDRDLRDTLSQYVERTSRMCNQLRELAAVWATESPPDTAPGAGYRGEVLVEERNVHGTKMLYPANPPSEVVCILLGMKTIPYHKVDAIKELGFSVRVVGQEGRVL